MTDPWFRMHASIGSKRVVWRLMDAAHIGKAKAVGHLAMFWGAVSQHCHGGAIADVPDAQLEEWAAWDGKRGVFARFVREQHSTAGIVNEYDEYSGALDLRREKDRARKAAQRERKSDGMSTGRHADCPQDVTRSVGVTSAPTKRNDTKQTTELPPAASRRTAKPKSEPKYPHYPTGLCQALHAKWGATMEQAIEYTIFRRDTAKAFPSPEAAGADEALILDTIELYRCEYDNASERDKPFFTPAKWATNYPRLLRIAALPLSVDGLPTEKAAIVFGGKAA